MLKQIQYFLLPNEHVHTRSANASAVGPKETVASADVCYRYPYVCETCGETYYENTPHEHLSQAQDEFGDPIEGVLECAVCGYQTSAEQKVGGHKWLQKNIQIIVD